MIVLSLVLVIAAAVLLVLGVFQDGLLLIYLSIGSCLLAMVLLGVGVLLRRRQSDGAAAPGVPAAATAGTAVAGPASARRGDDDPASAGTPAGTPTVRPAKKAVVRRRPADDAGSTGEPTPASTGSSRTPFAPPADEEATAEPTAQRPTPRGLAASREATTASSVAPERVATTTDEATDGAAGPAAPTEQAAPRRAGARKVAVRKAPATEPAADEPAATEPAAPESAAEPAAGDPLDGVRGLGPSRRAALLARFGSVDAIRNATEEELLEVRGVGPALARAIKDALG